jgi:hypothetical protein
MATVSASVPSAKKAPAQRVLLLPERTIAALLRLGL